MSCLPSPGTGRTQLLGSMSPIQAKWVLASIASLCLGVPPPLLIRIPLALYGTGAGPRSLFLYWRLSALLSLSGHLSRPRPLASLACTPTCPTRW